jgi:hypothetical protein
MDNIILMVTIFLSFVTGASLGSLGVLVSRRS